MSGMDMPLEVIRAQIATAVDVFIQQSRLKDGSRKIADHRGPGHGRQLGDLAGHLRLQDGRSSGHGAQPFGRRLLEPSGFRPRFYSRFEEQGIHLNANIFGADRMQFNRK